MKRETESFKTFVYPLDAIGFPIFFSSIFLFGNIAMAADGVWDFFLFIWVSLITLVPLFLIMWFERKIYQIVCIDLSGIYTKKVSFSWDDTCYKGVCVTTMGRLEHPKYLYFSKEKIVNEDHITLKRNTINTIIFPLTKKSKIALKKIAPNIYYQFKYEIEN